MLALWSRPFYGYFEYDCRFLVKKLPHKRLHACRLCYNLFWNFVHRDTYVYFNKLDDFVISLAWERYENVWKLILKERLLSFLPVFLSLIALIKKIYLRLNCLEEIFWVWFWFVHNVFVIIDEKAPV